MTAQQSPPGADTAAGFAGDDVSAAAAAAADPAPKKLPKKVPKKLPQLPTS
jgi:hypothetical protein